MGAKEVMVVCPLVVLLYDRTFLGGAKRTFLGALRKRWLFYLALFSTCAWPLYIATIVKPQNYGATSNVWAYAASQPAAILHYLRLAFWPVGQCFDMAWPLAPLRLTSIIIFAALALTVFELIKRPMLGFLGAWFFGILAITSSFFPTGDVIFEHRMYLPLSAVIVTVVLGAYWLWQHFALQLIPTTEAQWRLLGYETAIAAVLVLGLLTWRRNGIYSDEVALWQDCVAGNVTNARARANLGLAYMHFSRFAEAAVELREALKCSPNYSYALQNLGTTLVFMHKATPWEWTITAISGGDISYTGTYSTGTTGAYTYWTLTGSGTLTITSIP
jgi:tetratricopeptide (TPR) repeat protein